MELTEDQSIQKNAKQCRRCKQNTLRPNEHE